MNIFKNNKSRLITIAAAIAVAIVVLIGISVGNRVKDTDKEVAWEDLVPETETQTVTEEVAETETEPEPEIVYPAPDYDFNIEQVTVEIEGLDKEYRIGWVSDVHIISDHDSSGDVSPEYLDTLEERYETFPIDKNGVHSVDIWPEIIKYLNYEDLDWVIFGGDIMDYCSSSNIAIVKEGLDSLRMGYMYIRSDHDYGSWYGNYKFTDSVTKQMHQTIDGDEISRKFTDMGDFLIMGIDNSYMDMPEYYLSMVEDVLDRGKPVIMATHVPYASKVDDSLAELSVNVRNTLYYWGGKYYPNEVTQKYLDLIYAYDTAVCQVLGGHLHASWDGMISEQLSEHIFGPAYEGNIGIINVIPK